MLRFAAARIFAARVLTPELLTHIAQNVTYILVRTEQARRHHWTAKNLRPPPLKEVRTPWSAR
jgi:hypothetical protein